MSGLTKQSTLDYIDQRGIDQIDSDPSNYSIGRKYGFGEAFTLVETAAFLPDSLATALEAISCGEPRDDFEEGRIDALTEVAEYLKEV